VSSLELDGCGHAAKIVVESPGSRARVAQRQQVNRLQVRRKPQGRVDRRVVEGADRHAAEADRRSLKKHVLGGVAGLEKAVAFGPPAVLGCGAADVDGDGQDQRRAADAFLIVSSRLQAGAHIAGDDRIERVAVRLVLVQACRVGDEDDKGVNRACRRGSAMALAVGDPLRRPAQLRDLGAGERRLGEPAAGPALRERLGHRHAIPGRGRRQALLMRRGSLCREQERDRNRGDDECEPGGHVHECLDGPALLGPTIPLCATTPKRTAPNQEQLGRELAP